MIIGLTGPARSGKDTVAIYLVEHFGFKHFDFYRDVLVAEMERRGLEATKDNASKVGDELRKEKGNGVMAELLLEKVDTHDAVITGVRSPEEVEFLRKKSPRFALVLVDANKEDRYGRRTQLDKEGQGHFFERDERDFKNKGMAAVFLMADETIINDGTLEELHEKIDEAMEGFAEGEE